jgi:uroporphyrinogen decarboxylase
MGAYTGRQRVAAAFKKTFTDKELEMDYIPSYPIMGQCNAQLVGASIREFLIDPKVFLKAQLAAYERYDPDNVVMQGDLLMDVEAMGNELKFPEDSMCISTKVALEDKGKLSSLKLADPTRDGRMPGYLEVLAEAKKALPDTSVAAVIGGPWTIAIGLRGASELIRDAIKDPDYVHELMDFCSQMSVRFGEAVAPLKVGLSYSEAPASCSLISPKIYRTFIFPHHNRIVDHFKAKKVGVGLHVCGYADPILEDLVNTGVTNLSVDAPTDLAKAVEVTKGKAVLIGNVDTNSGYILASGCEVPGVAPPEKVDWFMEYARELAKWN